MKSIFLAAFSLISLSAFGAEIKITSFQNTGVNYNVTRAAEVCGKVTGFEGNMVPLKVTTDYNSSAASDYLIFTTVQGNFCTVIQTYLGRVQVELGANRGLDIQPVRASEYISKKQNQQR